MSDFSTDSLFDLFVFETDQNIEQIEQLVLASEKSAAYSKELVDEIFRVMHTIKGSAAMMQYDGISHFAHKVEDLFSILREDHGVLYDVETLTDLVLSSIDYNKSELAKLTAGHAADGDAKDLEERIARFAMELKNAKGQQGAPERPATQNRQDRAEPALIPEGKHRYKATTFFEDGCMMENIRAFDIVHKLGEFACDISHYPPDIIDDDTCVDVIRKNGFIVEFTADQSYDEITRFFMKQVFLKDLTLTEDLPQQVADIKDEKPGVSVPGPEKERIAERDTAAPMTSSIISVSVSKLDRLMDLLGELVIAEAMVIHNPGLKKLELESFQKAAGQLRKITGEMQDLVMSVRMVPLATTFQRMNRIVRDMNRKLGKEVELKIVGEETEVDKNIIDHIADPLMHLVRNSIDHGVEDMADRIARGKPQQGTVTLEAKNDGGDVLIIVRDDGKGLDKEGILKRATQRGMLTKPAQEMSDKEIYSLIFLPGFSTNDEITEFSGRGVGLDVVVKNIEEVGGRVTVESVKGRGSAFTMKFPLTLAIVEGMNLRVGTALYTLPITNIRESFRPKPGDTFSDPDGNEMIMVRGKCYPVVRMCEIFDIPSNVTEPADGILIMAENGDHTICLFADELIGQQEVVVKAMPQYIKKTRGLSGCTLLGDGQISLILDVGGIIAARQPWLHEGILRRKRRREAMDDLLTGGMALDEDTQKNRFLTFMVDSESYGLEISVVTEIIGIQEITKIPEPPDFVKGVINLRGRVIPVMDVRLRFRKSPLEYDDRTCIIVVDMQNLSVGLIVDSVSEVLTIQEGDIVPPPEFNTTKNRYVRGIAKTGGSIKMLLDCNRLLTEDEVSETSRAAAEMLQCAAAGA